VSLLVASAHFCACLCVRARAREELLLLALFFSAVAFVALADVLDSDLLTLRVLVSFFPPVLVCI
jgi:hypothetical protein